MKPYQYSPLPPDGDEIRLLRLLPGNSSADIDIEIFHMKASSNPVYEALSYVWGPLERCDHVVVGKGADPHQILPITRNLSIALHHLKLPSKPRTLWIDAISINQDDLSERSREVINMGSIYSNAKQVLVWLGPSSANSSLALETLCRISEEVEFIKDNRIHCKPGGWANQISGNSETLKQYAQNWVAIRDLIHREWFSRLWVFQEIGLAAQGIIIVGHDSLDWNHAMVGLYWIWGHNTKVNDSVEEIGIEDIGISNISGFLYRWWQKVHDLLDLFEMTQNLLCSDPRDRLFAIRSLTDPQTQSIIIPDYSKTVKETSKLFALRWIRHYCDLAILTMCLWQESTLTSWVPNLSLPGGTNLIVDFWASPSKAVFAYREDNQSLAVQGIQMATLSHITTPIRVSHTNSEILEHCRSWKQLVLDTSSGAECGSVMDAFFATIVTGNVRELMPSGNHLSFEECRKVLSFYEGSGEDDSALLSHFARSVRRFLDGRSFFLTEEGLFGVCPQYSRSGDRVAVLVGCPIPLILRPTVVEGMNRFLLIGGSYVYELMCNQAFLGPIPEGWSICSLMNDRLTLRGYTHVAANARSQKPMTQQDPRVPLPPDWRYRYGSWYEPQVMEADNEEHMTPQWFENVVTREKTRFDPRVTPEALRQRGVEVEELVLV